MKKITAAPIIIVAMLVTATVRAETPDLKTQTGFDLGLSLSSYKYEEPGLMSLEGGKIGVDMRIAKMFPSEWSIRGELRHAYGKLDYNGSGSASGNPDLYTEARFLVSRDWVINDAVLSPYTGGGYRYLYHDGRGISCTATTCYWGYRRESNYLYWPVGLTLRSALNNQARLVSTVEYDHLLQGKQVSHMSDGGYGHSDATNTQKKGYGLKLSVNYEKDNWAIGPFVHYWNIDDSDIVPEIQNGTPTGWGLMEPKNNTVEIGFKGSRQF
ncbi:MAG: hypothetical protein OEV15_00125 [Gallionella sp.]|nr:hypothetical protein [Gallionella sp.]